MSGTVNISRDIWHDTAFKAEPATMRSAFIGLALMGRIVRATVSDLANDWRVHERKAAQMIRKMEKAGLISVSGEGRCRLICIEGDLLQTCGFHVMDRARSAVGSGDAKWRGSPMSKALRNTVFARDNYTCRYCGATDTSFHVDHIKPVSKGGRDELSNLATACVRCNLGKGSKTLQEWRAAS